MNLPFLYKTFVLLASCCALSCDDDKYVGERELPQLSRTFLNSHFSGINILAIEKSNAGFSVQLANRIAIDFDSKGEWAKVDADDGVAIPTTFIVPQIVAYTQDNYPDNPINEVEKEATTFDIELLEGDIDLVFDLAGAFIRLDP